eukprot:6634496-Pyramimonas_sp.AAC.1
MPPAAPARDHLLKRRQEAFPNGGQAVFRLHKDRFPRAWGRWFQPLVFLVYLCLALAVGRLILVRCTASPPPLSSSAA